MPNDFSLPDDMQNRGDKKGGKDRRPRKPGRGFDDDDGARRNAQQRDRRQSKNFRDLLYGDDDDE